MIYFTKKTLWFAIFIILTFLMLLFFVLDHKKIITSRGGSSVSTRIDKLEAIKDIEPRDFIKYKCNDIRRIGGLTQYLKVAKDVLDRVDGAWYVCFDSGLEPVENNCNILSFGVSYDDSFDKEMHNTYKCNVYSFDPYVESVRVKAMREKDPQLYKNSIDVQLDTKWKFVNAGIVGSLSRVNSKKTDNKTMMTFDGVLKYLKLENQIIDVFKMDIEGGEFDVISSLNMDYICQHVKQFMIETHPMGPRKTKEQPVLFKYFKVLSKLEKCFSLFIRHTRFFIHAGRVTEWQVEDGFKLDLKRFNSEIDLSIFMFTYGELYFINENFLVL